jgi:hypothetical protein
MMSPGWHLIFQTDADMEEATLVLPGPTSADVSPSYSDIQTPPYLYHPPIPQAELSPLSVLAIHATVQSHLQRRLALITCSSPFQDLTYRASSLAVPSACFRLNSVISCCMPSVNVMYAAMEKTAGSIYHRITFSTNNHSVRCHLP